ncbi:MAG: hypothetical protein ACTTI6_04385 [Treponema sp.]|uniref:hypothetical protein n=1 Tax=Treponema sp. TaxID=166 RepID=UPI003FA2559C
MKNCISCSQAINDESVFCPLCGTPQQPEAVQKAGNPITAGAFLRIFRPSFFGSFERMKVKADVRDKLIVNFLCLSHDITDDEITELNMAFDILLNQPQAEYSLSRESKANYTLTTESKIIIENEKFRYNFVSDFLLDIIKKWANYESYDSMETFFGVIWLLALLSVLDEQYSEEKALLFSRMKNLFPISRKNFLTYFKNPRMYLDSVISLYAALFGISLESNNDPNTLVNNIPEDFDFYACVEDTIQKLCVLETNIQQLEQSEGRYADIKAEIEQLAAEERKLTELLPGFTYQKF